MRWNIRLEYLTLVEYLTFSYKMGYEKAQICMSVGDAKGHEAFTRTLPKTL